MSDQVAEASAQTSHLAPVVCLASASPRRRELLAQIGVPHIVRAAHIDETRAPDEPAPHYVLRMAREKALRVWHDEAATRLPVLAADTSVVLDGVVYGKPRDLDDAIGMLERLSGRTHEVITSVALATAAGLSTRTSISTVRFREISSDECRAYWESGEPRDKAGAYAIQGYGAIFVEELRGSYSGVMGLPLFETAELLRAAGLLPLPARGGDASTSGLASSAPHARLGGR